MNFERQYGFKEARKNDSITAGTAEAVVTCTAGYRIVVRRIRGSTPYDVTLKQGTTAGTAVALDIPVIQAADNFDMPGLFIQLTAGNNLYMDIATTGTPDINIQYALTPVL